MKALVTGAAGFIGAHVARQLLAAGHQVRALHRPGEDVSNLAGLALEPVAGDVTDLAGMRAAMAGCDQVFHLAAIYALWLPDPGRMRAVNVDGTATVLRAAREAGVRRVVHCSSIARFGGQGPGVRATEASRFALGPTGDAYAQSKADAHEVAVRAPPPARTSSSWRRVAPSDRATSARPRPGACCARCCRCRWSPWSTA